MNEADVDKIKHQMVIAIREIATLNNLYLSKMTQFFNENALTIDGAKEINLNHGKPANMAIVSSRSLSPTLSLSPFTYMSSMQSEKLSEIARNLLTSPGVTVNALKVLLEKGEYIEKNNRFVFHPQFIAASRGAIVSMISIGERLQETKRQPRLMDFFAEKPKKFEVRYG